MATPTPPSSDNSTDSASHSDRSADSLRSDSVRSVAHTHDGEVTAVPNPPGGLRVSVLLPFQQVGVTNPRMALGAHGGD